MLGTNHKHLYRHFNGGRLIEDKVPFGMKDVEYLGYVATLQYDGETYRSFIKAQDASYRLRPTEPELWKYGV